MSQVTAHLPRAEQQDSPEIACQILYRRYPTVEDIVAKTVCIIIFLKEFNKACCKLDCTSRTSRTSSYELRLHCLPYAECCCRHESDVWGADYDSIPQHRYRSQRGYLADDKCSQQPCCACRMHVAVVAFQVCRFLVAICRLGPHNSVDRRPYICRIDQTKALSIRDALSEICDAVKLSSSRKCATEGCTEWYEGDYYYPQRPRPDVLRKSLISLECPWALDYLDDELIDARRPRSESFSTREDYEMYANTYLLRIRSAERSLAEHMVMPPGISPRLKGILTDLSSNSCASGGWSQVYVATYKMYKARKLITRKVAVKLIRVHGSREKANMQLSKVIQAEVDAWVLARHPHLLPLYGVHWNYCDGVPRLVSPWCGNGDIVTFVARHELSLQFGLALRLLEEVLLGLNYLHTHTPIIVHCDLKGANILISAKGKALIADFGLAAMQAVVTESSFKVMSSLSPKGTYRWMAWELLFADDAQPTTASDIWSFACVVVETLTGRVPYHGLKEDQVFMAINNWVPPARPDDADADLWAILLQCWRLFPDDRPSADRLRDMIASRRPKSV